MFHRWLSLVPMCCQIFQDAQNVFLNFSLFSMKIFYYAPPSRPEGQWRCSDRGNAGGALVFMYLFRLLYIGCVYLAENWCRQNRILSVVCITQLNRWYWPSTTGWLYLAGNWCRQNGILSVVCITQLWLQNWTDGTGPVLLGVYT